MNRLLAVCVLVWAAPSLGHVHVDNTCPLSSDTPGGGSIERPFRSIAYAITQAPTNTTVFVRRSIYNEYNLTFSQTKNLTIEGYKDVPGDAPIGADMPEVISADANRAVYISAVNSHILLRNLLINPNNLSLYGGCVVQWASNADLTVENCQLGTETNSAIGIRGPANCGVTRKLVVDRCTIYCRHHGIDVATAGLVSVQNSRITSSSTINYAHVIQITGVVGNATNQVVRTIIRNNTIETTEASRDAVVTAVCGYRSELAKQFEVSGNNVTLRSKGSLVYVPENIPSVRVEFNRCRSIHSAETWTQINLGTDATPQVPPSNSLTKPSCGNIVVRGNYLEQTNTITPNPSINNGHGILIGQGVDFAEVRENIVLGADNGIVVKGEGAHVHHNGVFGGVPCLLKGTQNSTICYNTFVSNQKPAGTGCLDIQNKSDANLAPHPSGASGNRITDNIFMVWYGFDDLCVNDDPIGGFRPLSEDVKLNNNCYFAPSATVFSNLNRQGRPSFADHKAAWQGYSEMFGDNDATSVYKDPQLVNPMTGDFRLRRLSPVIGKGSIPNTNIGMWQGSPAGAISGG